MAPKDIPHIFDRFYQTDNSLTRHEGGTGIGLALVKELVQLMDGQIEVLSELGKGSEFIIQLPIKQKKISTKPIKAETQGQETLEVISKPLQTMESVVEIEPLATNGVSVKKQNRQLEEELPLLLIIEDNPDVLTYIQTCLNKDYSIEVARNGKEGIDSRKD